MGLRNRARRLERAAERLYRTLRLPGGARVLYQDEEMLDALSASLRREGHRLLPHVRRVDTREGMPGLIRALEGSREDG